VAQLNHLAGLDQACAAQHGLGVFHVVAGAALITRAPFGWATLGLCGWTPLRTGDEWNSQQQCGNRGCNMFHEFDFLW
jgi:hypothetical protein